MKNPGKNTVLQSDNASTASPRITRVEVLRRGETEPRIDAVAVEEPLEIRVAGETVAVIVRTPGDDHRLALGYLHAEGVIGSAADVGTVAHCGRPGEPGFGNVIDVTPASGARIGWDRLEQARRSTTTSSACGVCGRTTIEDLLTSLPRLDRGPPIPAAVVAKAIESLRSAQPTFDATGGTHGAGLWTAGGGLIAAHEDVGRHNAVDKVVGALLLLRAEGNAPTPSLLTVSGRAGFEIVQKAARAGVPVVASVSAPTSLAIDLSRSAGIALVGFVRGERMNVYASPERLSP